MQYSDLHPGRLQGAFDRTVEQLRAGNFRAADVKKLAQRPFYRTKLSDADRLLFKFGVFKGETHILLLEIIENHAYETSRFLNGATVDESKLALVLDPNAVPPAEREPLPYVHPQAPRFHLLDKIISFDDFQCEAFSQRPPLILIGSAGSGKTALTLEKIKLLTGDILYLTLSPYLAEHARNLYYAHRYENDGQNPDFLSFREFVESLRVPEGRPVTFRAFAGWYGRHRHSYPIKDAHMLFEEFNGVLTGTAIDCPFISREAYLSLGVRQSVFTADRRPLVYDIFEKYRRWMADEGWYDLNTTAYAHLDRVRPAYDFAVIDEVQDLTNIQVHLALRALRDPANFILSGDANQIVHPNFFSWASVKSMFYERRVNGRAEIRRILAGNFRNSPQVTGIANRLLLVKNARFGSIDRESNYLVRCVCENTGAVEFLADDDKTKHDLDARTARSTRFAVLVLREEDKPEARRFFRTPLLFSIQEAKGLEYENIVLVGFVSACRKEFNEIVEGVEPSDLERDRLDYGRARDKADKSLEAYKFFINALYVGITRAVRNLYWIESDTSHRLFRLLGLSVKGPATVKAEASSIDEWREEARKLELQGKQEQAAAIRQTILGAQPVPWKVITPDTLEDLKREALDPARFNKQAKQLLYEYALVYSVPYVFDELAKHKFNRAASPEQDRMTAERKYLQDYQEKSLDTVRRKIDLHGIDFRNPLNQTPLMIAARMGLIDFIPWLIKEGADPNARDNWGRIPLQIALRQAFLDPAYARTSLGAAYDALAPTHIKVKVEDRLIKIDRHMMEFFLLHSMMALFQEILRVKIKSKIPAFETGDFVHALKHFPEPIIPQRRRRRAYLTAVLARNEIFRVGFDYNRKLFVRVYRGYYLPNPSMDIEVDERWVNIYDLLRTDVLAREKDDKNLQYLLEVLARVREKIRKNAPAAHR
ncbi:MAG: hypothetical protein L6437_14960 [Kiritimatiellae bacterium]|nr:hypothetical protein [Kiritimatiellia bacterium]